MHDKLYSLGAIKEVYEESDIPSKEVRDKEGLVLYTCVDGEGKSMHVLKGWHLVNRLHLWYLVDTKKVVG